ncbi:MAG: YicC family protein [Bacteroidales bacterium]|nr:YicC family protein [Bacteroidales bacterium]
MIKSMTGYGKAEALVAAGKLTVEIRTLNGKNADINLKSSLLPKDKELLVRQMIADSLSRGTIDVFLTLDPSPDAVSKPINVALAKEYLSEAVSIAPEISLNAVAKATLLSSILRMPDVVDSKKQDVITEEDWPAVASAFESALSEVNSYRSKEGVALYKDVTSRVGNILSLYQEVEALEGERIETVRAKLLKALDELSQKPDQSRFEQEMIFYLEKYDINEEKVRLRQHCKYFMDTIDGDPCPGKKLGFIIQEMGREINTTGSKANHAQIQKLVVQMKDELEKIREQSMNIL